jgi:hypothetical protein
MVNRASMASGRRDRDAGFRQRAEEASCALFAMHHRPVQGARGPYRLNLRHGVSRLHSGQRHTTGIILHDAK